MYLCVRPSVQLYFLRTQSDGLILTVFDGKHRGALGPLSPEDQDTIEKLSNGENVSQDSRVVNWLMQEGWAEKVQTPVRHLPPSWSDHSSRQLSAYAMHAGIDGALKIQDRLNCAHVLIVGLGGIGCNVIQQLVRMGVSRFTLVDPDRVEGSNLNRQVLYSAKDIGQFKALAAEKYIKENVSHRPETTVVIGDFLEFSPPVNEIKKFSLAVVSADSAPAAVHGHAANLLFPSKIPYGFASYSGSIGRVGPLVFDHSNGCGCCEILRIPISDSFERIRGQGLPSIPPSSISTNAMLSAILVDRWVRSLSGKASDDTFFEISFDNLEFHSKSYRRLPSCPVCGLDG